MARAALSGAAQYDMATWDFRVSGLVEQEVSWSWEEFTALPHVELVSDIHCVTQWSRFDNHWEGIHIREVLQRVQPKPDAQFVMVHADPGYTTNVTLAELDQDDVLFALRHDGRPLPHEHGGPCDWFCPASTSGRVRSGCGVWSSWITRRRGSGREAAITCAAIPGWRSASGQGAYDHAGSSFARAARGTPRSALAWDSAAHTRLFLVCA